MSHRPNVPCRTRNRLARAAAFSLVRGFAGAIGSAAAAIVIWWLRHL